MERVLPFTINKHLDSSSQHTNYSNFHLLICPTVLSPVGSPLQSTEKWRAEESLAVLELKKQFLTTVLFMPSTT